MQKILRILYLILFLGTLCILLLLSLQNMTSVGVSFLHLQSYIPNSLLVIFSFFLGISSAIFAHLFIKLNRENTFDDSSFKDEEIS